MNIKVNNIGKVKQADIEIGDLTIFVGKNGTNKSYIAHTVYILDKILDSFRHFDYSPFFKEFADKLDIDIEEFFIKYKQKEYESYEGNIFAGKNRRVVYKFDTKDLEKEVLTEIYKFIIEYITKELNRSFNTDKNIIKSIILNDLGINTENIVKNGALEIESINKESDSIIALYNIFKTVIEQFIQYRVSQERYYFPASRTGFVLAFDEIVSGVLRDRFGGKPTATKLTEPTIDFISKFADIKSGKFAENLLINRLRDIIDKKKYNSLGLIFNFISNKIIFGNIIEKKSEENYTQFLLNPIDTDKNIEMHLSSSSVVELLSLIIFLKHFDSLENKFLVIEEPEAHLHPQAQIEIARLLVILVNFGAKVLITTHSDYILNEINNCIKLDKIKPKIQQEYLNKLQLPKNIIIKKNRIKAYLFKDIEHEIEVKKLQVDDYGISNENFDDILDELLDRTEYLNSYLDL